MKAETGRSKAGKSGISSMTAAGRLAAMLSVLLLTLIFTAFSTGRSFAASDVNAEIPNASDKVTEARVEALLSQMSTAEKISQMMMVAMPAKDAASVQEKYQFGGYILFGRDFARTNRKGMKRLLRSCQTASDIPMLMAVDEEGGTVVRASLYRKFRKKAFRSPAQVYKAGKYRAITKDTRKKDKFLKELGLNCNFGPVADVPYRKGDFMYKRAFSTKAGKTGKFVELAVSRMGRDDVVSALKHFPGYGNCGDTHGRIIKDKRSKLTFMTRDLRPFRAGIKAGADMVMMSHTIVKAFDKKNPASLSKKVNAYLRNELGFDGVIITDGLGMKGVTDFAGGDQGKAAVLAVKAGNDMICATGNYRKCHKALKKAVASGDIPEEQIDDSVRRILRVKIRRGIIK